VDDRQGLSQLERLIPLSQWNRHGLFTERKLHNPSTCCFRVWWWSWCWSRSVVWCGGPSM